MRSSLRWVYGRCGDSEACQCLCKEFVGYAIILTTREVKSKLLPRNPYEPSAEFISL